MKSLPIFTGRWLSLALLLGGISVVGVQLLHAQEESTESVTNTDDAAGPDTRGATAQTVQPEDQKAVALLQEARQQLLHERLSVRASVRQVVSMGPRKFRGEGSYIAGSYPKMRLSLTLSVGGTTGELLEVCDGQVLWTVQQIGGAAAATSAPADIQVTRTVIGDLREAGQQTFEVPEAQLISNLGLGGLPALLASLERSMTFEASRELEEDGRMWTVIQGRWSDESMQRMTGGQADAQLPDYLPDHVRVYFDAETMFPSRILYLKRISEESSNFRSLLSLEFTDIVLDERVDDELFLYTPGPSIKVRDRTGEYLQMMQKAVDTDTARGAPRDDGSVPIGDQ